MLIQIHGELAKRDKKFCIETLSDQIQEESGKNLEHLRKQVILLKIHSRQLNAIPMGFSRQKFCIENIIQNITQDLERLSGSQ